MAPPGAQPDLADDATSDARGHGRYDSTATQATFVADVAQPGANALDGPLKGAADNDDLPVVDNQRFRVTAGTPLGPNAAATTAHAGSPTAAAPMNIQTFTAAAPAVADPSTTAAAGPNKRPSGAHIEGAATGVVDSNGYEDSSEDGFDYNNAFVIDVPPGYKMIRVTTPGPDDYLDEDGNAWRGPVPIDDAQGVDEDEDWVLSGGAHDDTANANDDNGKDDDNDDDDDDAPPVPRATKRKRDDDVDEDEPAPRAPKRARRRKAFDIDELCARLAVIAWIIDVCGTCARLTDGRRDLFAGANADDAEGDAGADVDGPHNSENGSEADAADEHDEDADWVLQPLLYERSVPCSASMSVR